MPREPELQLVQQRTVNRTPQSVVADLVEALRQHVLQKSADKFQGRQSHGLPTVMAGVLVAETDLSILDREQTAIGQCNSMNIPASVAEDLFGPVHGRFTVDHPRCRPDRLRDGKIGTFRVRQIRKRPRKSLESARTGTR